MLRIVWGLVLGVLVGGIAAAVAIKGFGVLVLGAVAAYALAVAVGLVTGLVAGKPIWAADARIEATLKAIFGALLAAGMMYALRRWVDFGIDLSSLGLGSAPAGQLAATSLPAIGAVLALLFEADNLVGKDKAEPQEKRRVAGGTGNGASRARLGEDEEVEHEADSRTRGRTRRN